MPGRSERIGLLEMDESSALKVIAVRAVETADGARTLWSDEDRAWASRAAAEVVGAEAAPDAFLARRAALAIEKLGARHPALPRAVRALRWRPWVGSAIVGTRVRARIFPRPGRPCAADQHPRATGARAADLERRRLCRHRRELRRALRRRVRHPARCAARSRALRAASRAPRRGGAMREAIARVRRRLGASFGTALRHARGAHPALRRRRAGLGRDRGPLLRGIAFEYRASWESTFLDAPSVRPIVASLYAPGAFLTGIPLPDVDAVAAIHSPAGRTPRAGCT